MPRVVHRRQARRDLKNIFHHVAAENRPAARRLLETIGRRILMLADVPDSGSPRPEIGPRVRLLVVGMYVVIYERADDTVEIVRVVHGARDLARLV